MVFGSTPRRQNSSAVRSSLCATRAPATPAAFLPRTALTGFRQQQRGAFAHSGQTIVGTNNGRMAGLWAGDIHRACARAFSFAASLQRGMAYSPITKHLLPGGHVTLYNTTQPSFLLLYARKRSIPLSTMRGTSYLHPHFGLLCGLSSLSAALYCCISAVLLLWSLLYCRCYGGYISR